MKSPSFNDQINNTPNDSTVSTEEMGYCSYFIIFISVVLTVVTLPFSLILCLKVLAEYERAVFLRLGRLQSNRPSGPGLCVVIPCTDTLIRVDLRTILFDVPPQEILTKDSVTVTVDAVVYYKIIDPIMSVIGVANVNSSTKYLAQTTLRNVLGTKSLSEILAEKNDISSAMQAILDQVTDPWGVRIERVEVKDVKLPLQLQRAMAAEAEATREASAKVIAAKGELKASESLTNAAQTMEATPIALQLRYLQTLNTIAAEKNSTIIFPFPLDILPQIGKKN